LIVKLNGCPRAGLEGLMLPLIVGNSKSEIVVDVVVEDVMNVVEDIMGAAVVGVDVVAVSTGIDCDFWFMASLTMQTVSKDAESVHTVNFVLESGSVKTVL